MWLLVARTRLAGDVGIENEGELRSRELRRRLVAREWSRNGAEDTTF